MRGARSHWHQLPARVSSSPPAAPPPSGKAVMHSPSPSQFSSLLPSFLAQFLEAAAPWIMNNIPLSPATWLQGEPFFDITLQKLNALPVGSKAFRQENEVFFFMLQGIRWWCWGLRLCHVFLPGWKSTKTNMNIAFHTDVRNEQKKVPARKVQTSVRNGTKSK